HTRSKRDWSSDVCSSDLWMNRSVENNGEIFDDKRDGTDGPEEAKWANMEWNIFSNGTDIGVTSLPTVADADITYKSSIGSWGDRSEERRVGQEGGSRGEE